MAVMVACLIRRGRKEGVHEVRIEGRSSGGSKNPISVCGSRTLSVCVSSAPVCEYGWRRERPARLRDSADVDQAVDHAREAALVRGRGPVQDAPADGGTARQRGLGLQGDALAVGADQGAAVILQEAQQGVERIGKRARLGGAVGEAGVAAAEAANADQVASEF
jgi:hypothetical protein